MIRNARTFDVSLSQLAWWAVKIRLHVLLYCMYLQGLYATFVLPIIHFVCALLYLLYPFFPISPGCYSRCTQIEVQGHAKFWVHYVHFLIINRTTKEHQRQARTFDSRSGRGSKPRKRYVLNFLIKRTRSHLVCALQKPCHSSCNLQNSFISSYFQPM